MKKMNLRMHSWLLHEGDFENLRGSATVSLFQTSTFIFGNTDHGACCSSVENDAYISIRVGNAAIHALQTLIAGLK